MDRTAWIAVIACLAAMFFYGKYQADQTVKAQREAAEKAAAAAAAAPAPTETAAATASNDPVTPVTPDARPGEPSTPAPVENVEPQTITLENDFVRYHFTNMGAGVATAELLKHNRSLGGGNGFVTINEVSKTSPIGALSTGPGMIDVTGWQVQSQSATEVVFFKDKADGLRMQKRFWLPQSARAPNVDEEAMENGPDPYVLNLQLTIRNISTAPMVLNRRYLYTGAAAPLHINEWTRESGYFWKSTDDSMEFENVDQFAKGLMRKEKVHDEFPVEQLSWAGVNDQFYTAMIRAETAGDANIWARRFPIVLDGDAEKSKKKKLHAIEAGVGLPEFTLNVEDQRTMNYEFYLGPKEYNRLSDLGDRRTEVMHYDALPVIGWIFGWAIRPLAAFLIVSLEWMHGFVPYGVGIILITILIRLVIWPLYAKSTRTMKRMSKLTPKMKEIKEQYKDDPQKQNQEIMGLYRKYGVNPLGGCLPMFVQMPIFLGFYRMLSSAVELRHQPFLWIEDLSMPDTLFDIPGTSIPFNLLPLLMAGTMVIQMKVSPQSGDATQRMIFMLMPLVFLVICYNFASALALYWTTQNIFSIGQTMLMNKLPEPELKKKKLKDGGGGKGFMQRLQEQAEAQQKAKKASQIAGEKGDRHTKGKSKKKKKR